MIPTPILERNAELEKLVYEHPVYIPVPVVAAFLGANADGLRNCIEHGQCPFGIAWQKDVRGYKAFKIPTLTFYNWYTRGISYESEEINSTQKSSDQNLKKQ